MINTVKVARSSGITEPAGGSIRTQDFRGQKWAFEAFSHGETSQLHTRDPNLFSFSSPHSVLAIT
ncbi:hypothetical protein N7471_001576 [Penicillium samsonianum]|uniref:uncharacterized protein n=1 Tax=Penicillium samsonianum TaxID=1882272 RepID=UPI002548DFF5|nr:uncharacterized protein N7471_001576 [Penicillium samsonianum]KAJ6150377.1 hypothetical protein N7471_001576 [Penicillium samsonianum]